MHSFGKLFNGKKLRAVWDAGKKTWWVSVTDLVAALRDTDHDTARNYWKQIKFRMSKDAEIFTCHKIKLRSKDGRMRFCDVMRYKDIVKLIQRLPSAPSGGVQKFRKFIGILASNTCELKRVFDSAQFTPELHDPPLLKETVYTRLI